MNKQFFLILFAVVMLFWACNEKKSESLKNVVNYVKPLVGTNGEGNTYPAAVAPFGMIQIGPDTDKNLWATASGYEYSDSSIIGFSLTHFSGTGIPDLGDILFIPQTGKVEFVAGSKDNPDSGYRSRYSHKDEKVSAGYYSVKLKDNNVLAEMTASDRAGMFKFTFPEEDSSFVVVDLSHVLKWKVVWSNIRVENDSTISGYHQVTGWGKERYVYFTAVFSKKFDEFGIIKDGKKVIYNTNRFRSRAECSDDNIQFYAKYKTSKDETIKIRTAISAVSTKNAKLNLEAEIPHWDFDKVLAETKDKWNKELNKLTMEGTQEEKETFYTALYHTYLTPILFEDVNGEYRGFDQNVHKSEGYRNHAIFSLWDTYRATHPLFALIQGERNSEMINSMLAHYDQSVDKLLPVWSLYNNETWCMIGYHAVPVIADAYLKGNKGFNAERAFEAVKTTAMNKDYCAVKEYSEIGWVPFDIENQAVSKTLEYAYDDFTIAQFAKALGKTKDYEYFTKRALHYNNVFDKSVGFMRGRDSKGNWRAPFDPYKSPYWDDFTEGNSWQYTWYVPHDVNGLINLIGGKEKFSNKLDSLFLSEDGSENIFDYTTHGVIGQYWHGNEPSHHIAYLYNWVGKPWKTQELIHKIVKRQYGNKPNSLSGNDDCGQMSAWYLFNAIGFYPVAPASDYYVIGSPTVKSTEMKLSNGAVVKTKANNLSDKNIYIQSVKINGKDHNKTYFIFNEIKNGAEIIFEMGSKPNKNWGTSIKSTPPSISLINEK